MGVESKLIVAVVIAFIIGIAVGFGVGHHSQHTTTVTSITTTAAKQSSTQASVSQATKIVTKTETKVVTVTQSAASTGIPRVIKIGALLPLTGGLSSYAVQDEAALMVAQHDINEFFNKTGLPYRVEIIVQNTELKPNVALQKLQVLYSQGVKFIIGPMSSAVLRNIMGYADSNHIIIVSQSSTAPSLAIPGDYIFRLCPTDNFQGRVIASMVKREGISHIVIIWRGDAWGDGLENATEAYAKQLGIEVIKGIRYSPQAKEFSAEVNKLASIVSNLVNKYGADKVGVVLIAFKEGVQIMDQASQYPVLSKVRWFGSDGMAMLPDLVKDPVAAEFAVKTHFIAQMAAPAKSLKYFKVRDEIIKKLGRPPEPYAYNAYDAAWIITLSILVAGSYDPVKVKQVLPYIADDYFGASGWTLLDKAGDRAAPMYSIVGVEKVGGVYKWVEIGTFDAATNTFTPVKKS